MAVFTGLGLWLFVFIGMAVTYSTARSIMDDSEGATIFIFLIASILLTAFFMIMAPEKFNLQKIPASSNAVVESEGV